MIVHKFSAILDIEVDIYTRLVLTHNHGLKLKMKFDSMGKDTQMRLSDALAEDGVTIKGLSFIFPATGTIQAVVFYDPELDQVVARLPYFGEGDALLRLAAESGNEDTPMELIKFFDTFLDNVADKIHPDDRDEDEDSEL